MNEIKMEDLQETIPASEIAQNEEQSSIEQDPLKVELEKVTRKDSRTEPEKAIHKFKEVAKQLDTLGIDPYSIMGFKKTEQSENDDDAPVTMGMLKKLQQDQAERSALQLAEDIQNTTERELVKYHLENTIKSTGNPSKDLELASSIVNAVKNKQVLEELNRKGQPKAYSSSGGAGKPTEEQIEFTRDELKFMGPPFNVTKEQILASRKK